jgi:tetratricopeptide (TPR) repeat protein
MAMFNLSRKTRRDYIDEEEDSEQKELAIKATVAPLDKLDYLIAAIIAAAAAAFLFVFSYKGLHPDAWHDCVVAAGLRPPVTIVPGLWRVIAAIIYKAAGITVGNYLIMLLGKVGLGICVGLVYLTFREVLSLLVRFVDPPAYWKSSLVRALSCVSAAVFMMADPVWSLGYAFTPMLFMAILLTAATFLFAHFIGSGTVRPVYFAMLAFGLFCGESLFGIVALALIWFVFYILLTKGSLFHVRLLEPLAQQSSKWFLTLFWAIGLLFAVTVNIVGFMAMGGMEAAGLGFGALPLRYIVELWRAAAASASLLGWFFGLAVSAFPFVLALSMLRKATDVDHFLKYHVGLAYFALACVAYSQVSPLYPLWFWMVSKSVTVTSPLILYVFSFFAATTVLCALTVGVVDSYVRNHLNIALTFNPDLDEEDRPAKKGPIFIRNVIFAVVAVLLLAGQLPGRLQTKTSAMLEIVDAYIDEVVREAAGAKWLFTDGSYDCAIELESARRGKMVMCIPILPSPDGRDIRSITKSMPDAEDKLSASVGGANILRSWQASKPERIAQCAMQVGLEVWRVRTAKEYPPSSGVLARTEWPDEAEREAGVNRTVALAVRILDFYKAGGPSRIVGAKLNDLFVFIQWRIARLARVRSEILDRAGDADGASKEKALADALDTKNAALQAILEGMRRLKEHTLRQMTPREGLHFALVRADFMLARRFAEPILDASPDDVDANFGMGMSYFFEEQYSRAEEHLKRCLALKPYEPAFWNNLAVLQMRLEHYDEARKNVMKALELMPDSAEIKDTLREIDAAEKKAEERKAEEKKDEAKESDAKKDEKPEEGSPAEKAKAE